MRSKATAFSLLEIAIAIGLIVVLVVILIPVISMLRARAQRVQCVANLRNLHIASELYLQQNGNWPQIRLTNADDTAQQDYSKQWIEALKPFGPTEKTWICPTIQGLLGNPDYTQPENARTDYLAMPFDDKPTTPHMWPRQPWFAEVGDVHGHGNLVVFTDGSISDLKTLAPSQ